MRPTDPLKHPIDHGGVSGVLPDQHHKQPVIVEFTDTTTTVQPLPADPTVIEVVIPDSARVVLFDLRSIRTVAEGYGKAGVTGVASTSQYSHATCMSIGGDSLIATTAYNAVYSKASGALQLSHKVFDSLGTDIALTDAWIADSGADRVLKLEFTNYAAANRQLNVWGTVEVLG